MRRRCVLVFALLIAARPATAERRQNDLSGDTACVDARRLNRDCTNRLSPGRRALAITAAIIPGIVVRGAGSWVAGENRTAKRLFYVMGGALAAAGVFGGVI